MRNKIKDIIKIVIWTVVMTAAIATIALSCETPTIAEYLKSANIMVHRIRSMGSGTILKITNEKIYILTAKHIVPEKERYYDEEGELQVRDVELTDYTIEIPVKESRTFCLQQPIKIIRHDKLDVAIIVVPKPTTDENETLDIIAVKITEKQYEETTEIYTVSNPHGVVDYITKGIISKYVGSEEFYIDAGIARGSSGGGVFTKDGYFIGVPISIQFENPFFGTLIHYMGYCVSVYEIKDWIETNIKE